MARLTASLVIFSANAGFEAILAGEIEHEALQLLARHHVVHHAEPMRLLRGPAVGGEQELFCLARAELEGVHEPFDAADAHGHHRIAELGIVAGDDQVAGPGEHQPAGDAAALNLGDGRLGEVAPAAGDLQVDFLLAGKAAVRVRLIEAAPPADRRKILAGLVLARGAQVMAGGEVRVGAGEHDDLDGVVLHRAVEGGVQVVGHLQVLRIARIGPVHHDPRHIWRRLLVDDGFVFGHAAALPLLFWG